MQLSPHAARMQRLYRWHALLFDLTRGPLLLGRRRLQAEVSRLAAPGSRVLEVGCGTGHNLPGLRRAVGSGGAVVGVECAPAMLRRARRQAGGGIHLWQGEYGRDPGPGGLFDAVVFSYCLSMVEDYEAAIAQAHRDLEAGGHLLLLDFVHSPHRRIRHRMARFGVHLGEARAEAIARSFEVQADLIQEAWWGLWTWRLLVARKKGRKGKRGEARQAGEAWKGH